MVYLKTCKIIAQGLNYNAFIQKYNKQSTDNIYQIIIDIIVQVIRYKINHHRYT